MSFPMESIIWMLSISYTDVSYVCLHKIFKIMKTVKIVFDWISSFKLGVSYPSWNIWEYLDIFDCQGWRNYC